MKEPVSPARPMADCTRQYWRGLDELAATPAFREGLSREFPAGAAELAEPVTRRDFLKLMSASLLLAGVGLTGCRRPEEQIVPFSQMPENYTHGVSQFYATAMPARSGAIPLVVEASEGRPIKIEGNPGYPDALGGTDRFAQASILDLYDPDRARNFLRSGEPVSKRAALDFLVDVSRQAQATQGRGLCILMEHSTSPSRARLQAVLRASFPRARWFVYEPVDFEIHARAAALTFGKPVRPYVRLDRALRIVSFDCDFLGTEGDSVRFIRDFAKGRKIPAPDPARGEDLINRLYAVECLLTLTGAHADHRCRVPASAVVQVAAALAREVVETGQLEGALARLGRVSQVNPGWIQACARDLRAHAGRSVVLAGYQQPLVVHVLAHLVNVALHNVGHTVLFHDSRERWPGEGGAGAKAPLEEGSIEELAQALHAGQVETLIILAGNPVYNAPGDLDWAQTQRKAKVVVRLGYYADETSALSDWHFSLTHYLESWGDARTSDGTLVPVQPLIAPLFDGITELEFLARLGGLPVVNPYEIVRETHRLLTGGGQEAWERFLQCGFQPGSAARPVDVKPDWPAIRQVLQKVTVLPPPSQERLEVVFHRDARVDDGRFNNNGWLQELPDPITKVTWENVFLISPTTAQALGLEPKDDQSGFTRAPVVRLYCDGREIVGPIWIQPGMADWTVGLALGYGRWRTGRIGRGSGYNAFRVRTSTAPYCAAGAKLRATGQRHPVACTQSHWAMEGRAIVREADLIQYFAQPDFARAMDPPPPGPKDAHGHPLPLYRNPLDEAKATALHHWGMVIDLNACVGCSACVLACQSENNVPIVGKTQVGKSREMHWLRVDRYYTGTLANPQVVMQPMLCQHCEAAPCENVCPVNATVHDEEGLNLMVYNRCIGTRYCSNNCPYKVRRFNFFDYHRRPAERLYRSPLSRGPDGRVELMRWLEDPDRGSRSDDEWELLKLVQNPEVTIRMRGVMEKCTFCLQRIQQARIAQKVAAGASSEVQVPDGVVQTACQQACPAQAIVFGNLKDPNSRVAQLKRQARNYSVLEFLNLHPRTSYLARVRNPNPAIQESQPAGSKWTARAGRPESATSQPGPPPLQEAVRDESFAARSSRGPVPTREI